VLTFAVLVGNAPRILLQTRLALEPVTDREDGDIYSQLVFIVKSFFFTFIGAMLTPPWGLAALGVTVGAALLPMRLPGAWLTAWMLRLPAEHRGILSVAVPRGLAAGVLATLPAAAGVPGTQVLPNVVFPTVVTTILVFTVGFRLVRRGPGRDGGGLEPPAVPASEPMADRGTPPWDGSMSCSLWPRFGPGLRDPSA
jgi:NhaP-type Na+/H+ or K+/H+ antiporter